MGRASVWVDLFPRNNERDRPSLRRCPCLRPLFPRYHTHRLERPQASAAGPLPAVAPAATLLLHVPRRVRPARFVNRRRPSWNPLRRKRRGVSRSGPGAHRRGALRSGHRVLRPGAGPQPGAGRCLPAPRPLLGSQGRPRPRHRRFHRVHPPRAGKGSRLPLPRRLLRQEGAVRPGDDRLRPHPGPGAGQLRLSQQPWQRFPHARGDRQGPGRPQRRRRRPPRFRHGLFQPRQRLLRRGRVREGDGRFRQGHQPRRRLCRGDPGPRPLLAETGPRRRGDGRLQPGCRPGARFLRGPVAAQAPSTPP